MKTQALDNIVSLIMEALYTCYICNRLHVQDRQKHTHSELAVHTLVGL